jgi:hypothetical protein
MNDQLPTDQRQLENVTSRKLLTNGNGNGSGSHDVAARRGWLALGAAVEASGRDGLNEQALLASLQAELIKSQPTSEQVDTSKQVDWSWAAVIVAATVLLAATIVGVLSQRQEKIPGAKPGQQLVQPSPQPVVPREVQPVGPNDLAVESVAPRTDNAIVASESSSWNDLDEAINTTYTALQKLTNPQSGVDQSLTDFDTQLKQLSADIADESL